MPQAYVDANEFSKIWLSSNSVDEVARKTGTRHDRAIMTRRRRVERELGIILPSFRDMRGGNFPKTNNVHMDVKPGSTILIGSDRHNLPGRTPQAFLGFLQLASEEGPDVIVINGDWFDFSDIGRFHRIGWQERPGIDEELEEGTRLLDEIRKASPRSKFVFVIGNHDMRYDGILSNRLPQFENVRGFSLENHIQQLKGNWKFCDNITINDTLVIKHRWHGGQHSDWNNVLRSGKNLATGHTHHLRIRPHTDYSGKRYGIETGMLSDLWDETFSYIENNPANWQPGFVFITVEDNLIIPETCEMVIDEHHKRWGKCHWRGKWYG